MIKAKALIFQNAITATDQQFEKNRLFLACWDSCAIASLKRCWLRFERAFHISDIFNQWLPVPIQKQIQMDFVGTTSAIFIADCEGDYRWSYCCDTVGKHSDVVVRKDYRRGRFDFDLCFDYCRLRVPLNNRGNAKKGFLLSEIRVYSPVKSFKQVSCVSLKKSSRHHSWENVAKKSIHRSLSLIPFHLTHKNTLLIFQHKSYKERHRNLATLLMLYIATLRFSQPVQFVTILALLLPTDGI